LSPQGEILAINEPFSRLSGMHADEVCGRNWFDLLQPASPQQMQGKSSRETLQELARDGQEIELFNKNDDRKRLRCRISPLNEENGAPREYACVGKPSSDQASAMATDRLRLPRQTVISELSAGVAHEISDLSNGIINYAQLLTDDASLHGEDQAGAEIRAKIIDSGERIAEIVHKLIFYGQKESAASEYLPLATVLDDAIMLMSHHLRTEGIQLDLGLADKPLAVPVHAQMMQQVFINLFNHRRHSLNRRYSGRDANKRLTVGSENILRDGQRLFQISFGDKAGDLTAAEVTRFAAGDHGGMEIFDGPLKELALCRELVESQGGTLRLSGEPGQAAISVQVSFPLKG
ncbi:MAG: PAS domain-containing sensor histidine kinase, partial [Desulfobulbaceae bacterium]|nr:PAS domain-containing sensor histidine kinase [Desulfobulbaceae bacterium]